jgi:hypothetical protein
MSNETNMNFNRGNQNIGAIGSHARVRVHQQSGYSDHALTELANRLAELRMLIERHAAALEDAPGARASVDDVAAELRGDDPQPRRIRAFLNNVAAAAPGVTAVTQMVRELVQLASPSST